MILVIGTSLSVSPFNQLPHLAPDDIPLVIMNREPITHLKGQNNKYIFGNCDDSILRLCKGLGWEKELMELYKMINGRRFKDLEITWPLSENKQSKCVVPINLSQRLFTNRKRPRNDSKDPLIPSPSRKGICKTKERQNLQKRKPYEMECRVVYDCIEVLCD